MCVFGEQEHFDDEVTHDQVLLIPFMKAVMVTQRTHTRNSSDATA